jgi:hypothetical protein
MQGVQVKNLRSLLLANDWIFYAEQHSINSKDEAKKQKDEAKPYTFRR